MQKVTLGILAHVDSGKRPCPRGLPPPGALCRLGCVDHGDASRHRRA